MSFFDDIDESEDKPYIPRVPTPKKNDVAIALLESHIKHLQRTKMNGKTGLVSEAEDILKLLEGK